LRIAHFGLRNETVTCCLFFIFTRELETGNRQLEPHIFPLYIFLESIKIINLFGPNFYEFKGGLS